MNYHRYKYEYRYLPRHGSATHSYEIVGRFGALQLHIKEYENNLHAGLEIHYIQPLSHMRDVPSNMDCWLTKTPCWHNGTSLYAEEYFLPHFTRQNHQEMFDLLTQEADRHFYQGEEESA